MEIWKDIENYPGYQVSSEGRIRTHNKVTSSKLHSERHWKDRILKQKTEVGGAKRVTLWKDGKPDYVLVHRVEAISFLGNPPEKNMTVNHIDGNRQNNNIDNLEWLSLADNIRHGFVNGLYPSHKCKLVGESGEVYWFYSKSDAARFLGRSNTYLCRKNNKSVSNLAGRTFIFNEIRSAYETTI